MTQHLNSPVKQPVSFSKAMLVGAAIGLAVISFFIFGLDNANPAWGQFWRIKPLLITPAAGATAGAFYAFMDYQAAHGFNRAVALVLSLVVGLIGIWMGVVLGLNGTMWD